MAITDPAGSVYMNNMYVTGNTTSATNANQTASAAASNAAASTASALNTTSSSNNASTFASLLSNMMTMNAVSSIGNFSNSSSGDSSDNSFGNLLGMSTLSGMSGMSGLGGLSSLSGLNANSLMGLSGSDSTGSSMIMALLMMLLASQNENGQNNNILNSMTSGSSSNSSDNSQNGSFVNNYGSYNANNTLCKHMLQNASSSLSSIPSNSWTVSNAAITSLPGQRSASVYRAVIDQFDVENNERYRVNKQGIGDTYCNIFTWDVTRAMGAEVPHYIETATGKPASSSGTGVTELNANSVNDWLNKHGESYGWTKVSAEEAQYYANNGMPAITSWKNSSGHGHLQVVCPSRDGNYNSSRGVTISQAGRQLKNYDYIDTVYGANSLSKVEYFVHI